MDLGLAGTHAVVTGAAAGIGLATSRCLAAEGATVGMLDRSAAALSAATTSSVDNAVQIYALEADVTDAESIREAFDAAADRAPIDVLVVNAGIYKYAAIDEIPLEDWDLVHGVNVRGAFLCVREVLPAMKRRRSGAIVFVSSLAGRSGGLRASAAYASSKAGLIGLSRNLALEAASFGIRVNCVNPASIDTPMTRATFPADVWEETAARHPLRRWGRAEEVANAITFLASPAASWISAAQLDVNGGIWAVP